MGAKGKKRDSTGKKTRHDRSHSQIYIGKRSAFGVVLVMPFEDDATTISLRLP